MESLVFHLLYEFGNDYHGSKKILTETRGVVSGLNDVVKYLSGKMSGQIEDTVRLKTEITQIYNGDDLSSFFNDYLVELTTDYDVSAKKPRYSGGLFTKLSFFDTDDGVLCRPCIRLKITGNDEGKIEDVLSFCLGHELTHAYDMYQYALSRGCKAGDLLTNIEYGQGYTKMFNAVRNNVPMKKFVGELLYTLNRMERNAYIAQLKQELDKAGIYDSGSALKAIKQTSSYGRFIATEQKIKAILHPETSDDVRREIMVYTNELADRSFSNYEQVKKYYVRRWLKWKKKYLSTASKIAHDIYIEHKKNTSPDKDFLGEIGL